MGDSMNGIFWNDSTILALSDNNTVDNSFCIPIFISIQIVLCDVKEANCTIKKIAYLLCEVFIKPKIFT